MIRYEESGDSNLLTRPPKLKTGMIYHGWASPACIAKVRIRFCGNKKGPVQETFLFGGGGASIGRTMLFHQIDFFLLPAFLPDD